MRSQWLSGRSLVHGTARGSLLVSEVGLSFWGGIDPVSGEIIDHHHPLAGQNVAGKILAIPSGRGSCSGSGALLELILNERAPAALVFAEVEEILTLGVLVAELLFERSLPVICVDQQAFRQLHNASFAHIAGTDKHRQQLCITDKTPPAHWPADINERAPAEITHTAIQLDKNDQALLDGAQGRAAQAAMKIILRMAEIQGATELLDVTQAHIDACVYHGPSSLRFAQRLVEWGGRVRVPTTLNSISVDKRQWQNQGVDPTFGEPASQLGDAYMAMGAQLSYTCAPYLLDTAPKLGEQIVWAESNAVTYANSVIGARTQKYPDFLDACIALTGRAPATGSHLDAGRHATLCIQVDAMPEADDSFWPTLGYHIGLLAANELPVIFGLEKSAASTDDLKAFSAAFATTSASPMFHIAGVTPEASAADERCRKTGLFEQAVAVTQTTLLKSWHELNTATVARVDIISLGNPHFSVSECAKLADLCEGREKAPAVSVLVTLGRAIYAQAEAQGYISRLQHFGVQFITDTCWCMITEPVIPPGAQTLMTNSGKYAHYAPGLVGRAVHFGSLVECVDAACDGYREATEPVWG